MPIEEPVPNEEELVKKYLPVAMRAYDRVRRSSSVSLKHWKDEMISDTHLGLLRAIRTHDPTQGDIKPWIFFKVMYEVIDGIKNRTGREGSPKRGVVFVPLEGVKAPFEEDFHRAAEKEEASKRVHQMLERIPSHLREPVLTAHTERGEMEKLADRLGVTPSRVSQMKTKGIKIIRENEGRPA